MKTGIALIVLCASLSAAASAQPGGAALEQLHQGSKQPETYSGARASFGESRYQDCVPVSRKSDDSAKSATLSISREESRHERATPTPPEPVEYSEVKTGRAVGTLVGAPSGFIGGILAGYSAGASAAAASGLSGPILPVLAAMAGAWIGALAGITLLGGAGMMIGLYVAWGRSKACKIK